MIIQARMENIFNFLSSCDTFHMSALFLLKPLTFLFGLSVLFVFPQKKKKKKKYKLYPGGKQRQGWGSISQLICSHLPSPCNSNAAESCSFSHCSPSISHPLDNSGVFSQVLSRTRARGWSQAQEQIRDWDQGTNVAKSRFVEVLCCPSLTYPWDNLAWDSSVQPSASFGASAQQPHHETHSGSH